MIEKDNKQIGKKRYWFKVGIIFEIIFGLSIIIKLILQGLGYLTIGSQGLVTYNILFYFNHPSSISIIELIGYITTYFFIGALIGYIYGKIRERKTKK